MELIVATKNKKKLQEIREILSDLNVTITSLSDYPDAPEIIEDGRTFAQNAAKKAATIALYTGKFVMGEDSGLVVTALGGRPGVYSARYSGPQATDRRNNLKLLRELRGVPARKRQASYRCCVALADGKGLIDIVSGSCRGEIIERSRGHNGFGYDPLFLIPRYGRTFGELSSEIKHTLSHRYRALKKARVILAKYSKEIPPVSS